MNLLSGYPFWLIKDGLPYNYPRLEQSVKTDVLILGGGISGALSAYHLANAGVDCIVVDARTIGLGSTCASTALLQYELDVPLFELQKKAGLLNAVRAYKLCADAIGQLQKIADKLKFREFRLKKSLYYAAYKKDMPLLRNEFLIRKEHGFKMNYLDQDQLLENYHFNAPGAILSECGAEMDAYSFTHVLLQNAIKNGLRVFDRTAILHIEHQKNGVILRTDKGHVVKSKKIIYATGYEVQNIIDKEIVQLHSTYATISEQANEKRISPIDGLLIWNTADPYLYMRTTPDRRILIGGRDEKFFDPVMRDKLINKKKGLLVKDFNRIFPDIEFIPEFTWAGTFGSTNDGLPFIGTYPKLNHSFFSLGFGGNGITFSQIGARILVDLIIGKKNPDADIFSFDRI